MYDKFRFRRHDILTIVDELRDDLEYPDTWHARPLDGYSANYSNIADVCEFVSRTWWLRPSASTNQPHPEPSIPCDQRFGRSDAWVDTAIDTTTSRPAQGEVPPASRIPHRGGMHWRDPRPHEHECVNRKNFHSINIQVTCDLSNTLNFSKPLCCGLTSPCHGVCYSRNISIPSVKLLVSRVVHFPTNIARFPQRRQPVAKRQPFPTGYCFAFCSEGCCSNPNCNFAHKCPTCNGPHALSQCPDSRHVAQFKRPPTPFHRPVPPFKHPAFPLRLPTPVHVVRLWQFLLDSRYDPALSRDICSGFTYGFPLSFQGDVSHRAIPCNHPSLLSPFYK